MSRTKNDYSFRLRKIEDIYMRFWTKEDKEFLSFWTKEEKEFLRFWTKEDK